jgi:type IV pilus assembly protein PilC
MMPFLPFEAIDANGKSIRGTVQADNLQQLELILLQKGLRPVSLGVQPAAPPMQVAAKPASRSPAPISQQRGPIQTSTPRPISRESGPAPSTIAPSTVPQSGSIRTPELTNKQKFLLFNQFASFVRSGFSSSQMIQHATSRMPTKLRSAFGEMEQETAAGLALSESMAKRPMMFPPDQVAVVKAGEQSGHMEEAFQQIALQAERANGFRMTLGYFFIMFPLLILCGVGGIGLQKASAATLHKQFDADGMLPVAGTLITDVKGRLVHEFLLAFLIAGGFILLMVVYHKYPFRKFRHKAALLIPVGRSRAKSEAVERFSWAMASMLKGGASPASAVHIAAASIPNLTLREEALRAVGTIRETDPLGALMQRTGLLSPDQVHMVQNGELVGDMPGALNTIARAESDMFQSRTTGLKAVTNVALMTLMALFTAAMVGFLYYMYASNLVNMFNNIQ